MTAQFHSGNSLMRPVNAAVLAGQLLGLSRRHLRTQVTLTYGARNPGIQLTLGACRA